MTLNEWTQRWWHVLPPQAQAEFQTIIQPHEYVQSNPSDKSEAAVQADIRLDASRTYRAPLYRNNSGAMTDEQGRHIRFGLGNDSKRVNDAWKSADLIGITPVSVTTEHVGKTLGVFTAVEVKAPGWKLLPSDKRAKGQSNFLNAVLTFGGYAGFAQSVEDFRRIIGK